MIFTLKNVYIPSVEKVFLRALSFSFMALSQDRLHSLHNLELKREREGEQENIEIQKSLTQNPQKSSRTM